MAYNFHYTPTGTGVISGKEVLEQTEDAINDLGNTAISGVQEALDKAEQALTNSENAVDDAQTALNTANNAEGVAIQAQTDVGNLSGTVTNIGNRVTTAEGNITNLQGRMTTAEGNITNLQGRMTTAEGNIGNLQTAVSTAQATANSAQQTATTARQQSYVFRYSSTALTASSTNSNTLLDNTDNLKVGDKVIDSSGVLFSVTAIDTQNSTFTIGTALIDLAQDSDVVHKSGNETVGGTKTFSDNPVIGSNNVNITVSNRQITANGSYSTPTGNSYSYIQLKAMVNYTDSSPSIDATVGLSVQENAYSDGKNRAFNPSSNNIIDLGLPSKRWANVYATNYYYGGSEIEFSQKFVTTDTNQTISGAKTFSDDITLQGTTTPVIKTISNIVQDTSAYNGSVSWVIRDKDNLNNILESSLYKYSAKSIDWQLKLTGIDNGVSNTKGIRFTLDPVNNVANFIPIGNNNTSLGNSSTKWNSVYATEYYYGSNNVEFSQKFVTTDTAQTISGNKTFSSDLSISNTDTTANTPNLTFRNYKVDRGTTDTGVQTINFLDKNAKALTLIESRRISNGNTGINILCYNTDDSNNTVSGGISIIKSKTDTNFAPNTDNAVNCGRPLAKWSDVQTYKVNALEPSSLSLPSGNVNNVIDISSYITALDGTSNSYTVPANGWISIAITGTAIAIVSSSWSDSRLRESSGNVRMLYPVLKNETLGISVIGTTLSYARFIPCQGNV